MHAHGFLLDLDALHEYIRIHSTSTYGPSVVGCSQGDFALQHSITMSFGGNSWQADSESFEVRQE